MMGWIQRFWDKVNPPLTLEQRAIQPWDVYGDADIGLKSAAGTRVTEETAFTLSIAWASMTLIADGIAALPPEAYRITEDGSDEAATLPSWIARPHPEVRRFDFTNQVLLSLLAWGNAYCKLIRRPSDFAIVGLDILPPDKVTAEWHPEVRAARRYKYKETWYSSREILHFQGPTLPGDPAGMSVISQAREAIGLGLTLEEYGARYFGQGAHAKIVIEMPQKVDESEARRIVKTYERFHRGKNNWHRPAIMSGGAKLHNISIPPDDAQFLESRAWQAMDVARWFRVPPHRVGVLEKSTSWGSGLAEENKMLLQVTYHPWIQRLEEGYSAYSAGGESRGTLIRLKTEDILHGTFKEQVDIWTSLFQGGLTTKNESRRKIGLRDVEGGDEFIDPMLMNGMNNPRTPEQDRARKTEEASRAASLEGGN